MAAARGPERGNGKHGIRARRPPWQTRRADQEDHQTLRRDRFEKPAGLEERFVRVKALHKNQKHRRIEQRGNGAHDQREMQDVAHIPAVRRCDIFWSTIIIAGFINALDDYSEGAVLELPLSDRAITRREEIRKYRVPRTEKVARIERVRGRSNI